jgi:hypothetical protein
MTTGERGIKNKSSLKLQPKDDNTGPLLKKGYLKALT